MSDMFSEENIPSSAWFKFDTVGQVVKGTLVEKYTKEAEGNFPAQTVYKLTKASVGTADIVNKMPKNAKLEEVGDINVGSSKSFVNSRLSSAKQGDKIGFAFVEEIAPTTKGFNPAKSIIPFNSGADNDYLNSLGDIEGGIDNPFE